MTRSTSVASGLVVLALLCNPAPAADRGADVDQRVRVLYDTAMEQWRAERFDEAGHLFDAAFRMAPAPPLLWNAARAFHQAGDAERARERYVAFLDMPDVAWASRRKAATYLRELVGAAELRRLGFGGLVGAAHQHLIGAWTARLAIGGGERHVELFLLDPHVGRSVGGYRLREVVVLRDPYCPGQRP